MIRLAILALMTLVGSATTSRAGIVIAFQQVGSDVVATGSGTINTSALTAEGIGGSSSYIYAYGGTVVVGAISTIQAWSGITGPYNFGNSTPYYSTSASGSHFGVMGEYQELILPYGYTSGSALSGSATWTDATLSGLGVPSTEIWTWGSGSTADFLEVGSVVPEPSSMVLAGLASGTIGIGAWLRLLGVKR